MTPPKALSTPLPCFVIIVLLKSAFLFFVLTSGRPLPVTTFFVFSKPLCIHFAAQIVIREFSAPLEQRCLSLSKGFPLQRETAKIFYCCSQPFCSSFVALIEVILQRCGSAARFVRVIPKPFIVVKILDSDRVLLDIIKLCLPWWREWRMRITK